MSRTKRTPAEMERLNALIAAVYPDGGPDAVVALCDDGKPLRRERVKKLASTAGITLSKDAMAKVKANQANALIGSRTNLKAERTLAAEIMGDLRLKFEPVRPHWPKPPSAPTGRHWFK